MTATVSPRGHDSSSHAPAPDPGPHQACARRGAIQRIAEEEHILVVLLAGFALVFLLVFPQFILVNDSWLNLMAGREVVETWLPRKDELTVYGLGSTWTDQQWLAQVTIYGAYSLGGHALLSILTAASVVSAFSIAAAASRSLGAGPRAIWVFFLPVLFAAPWAWSIRAQMLALPLYTGLLWLLALQARRPSNRIWIALPLLVVWGNVHGSAALGAILVALLAIYELVRSRGSSWRRSVPLGLLAPLAALMTPYGPVTTARYYHLLLIDPPFAGRVTEWSWSDPAVNTMFFYVLVAVTIPLFVLGRRRLTLFDFALLALTLVGAVTAIRGIVWFALACMVFAPVALGQKLESRNPEEPRRGLNIAIAFGMTVAVVAVAASLFTKDNAWFEKDWPRDAVEAVRQATGPDDRVFAPDRFSNWLLWKIPDLRGRVAYDVRFELYDREFFDRLGDYGAEAGDGWKSFADGYRIVLVDETRRSHTADFLAEPRARAIYRGDEVTVIARRPDRR